MGIEDDMLGCLCLRCSSREKGYGNTGTRTMTRYADVEEVAAE